MFGEFEFIQLVKATEKIYNSTYVIAIYVLSELE